MISFNEIPARSYTKGEMHVEHGLGRDPCACDYPIVVSMILDIIIGYVYVVFR